MEHKLNRPCVAPDLVLDRVLRFIYGRGFLNFRVCQLVRVVKEIDLKSILARGVGSNPAADAF